MDGFVVILLISAAISPIIAVSNVEVDWNSCPNPRTVQNFNAQRFKGTWYDIERYRNPLLTGRCGTAFFRWNGNNEVLNLTYTNIEDSGDDIRMKLRPVDLRNGVFRVYQNGRRTPLILYILDTDYVNYSIIWTCTDIMYGVGNTQSLNIFSRTASMDRDLLDTAINVVTSRGLDDSRLMKVQQDSSVCERERERGRDRDRDRRRGDRDQDYDY